MAASLVVHRAVLVSATSTRHLQCKVLNRTADVMGVGVLVNTQDDFHVYRMTVKDGYATLFIDDNFTAATVQPLWAGDFGASMIRFGDVTGDEDAQYKLIMYVGPLPAHLRGT